ncbi:MAG: glycosyltransferase [Clostridia bacterium]|nr:glycosyltransferase [Clostridia bacterium]
MRIVQIAPDVYPLPAGNYGGLEKIVYELTEELVRRGHEVYIFAPEGSKTGARLIPYKHREAWNYNEIVNRVMEALPENTGIIHDHTHYSLIGRLKPPVPTVCTVHIPSNNNVRYPVYVSKRALELYGGNSGFYVYNGLRPEEFEFSAVKDDYLLYLGTLTSAKGAHCALDIADRMGMKLIMAGPSHVKDYFSDKIEPLIKRNTELQYTGPVAGKLKQILLKYAKCVLFPTLWEEPFGLVMIEAMACGTPVLGLAHGAVPEVLKGFPYLICQSVDEMAVKLQEANFPEPGELREFIIQNFTVSTMTDKYLEIYRGVMEGYGEQ